LTEQNGKKKEIRNKKTTGDTDVHGKSWPGKTTNSVLAQARITPTFYPFPFLLLGQKESLGWG
jgi:hypothetical protein